MPRPRTTEPRQPNDARAQRSIEALKSSFLGLLEHRPFEQIAIKDITEGAQVSYPTFFRRFGNKEELFDQIAAEEVRTLLRLGATAMTERGINAAERICVYVQPRRHLWAALLTGGASSVMRSEFMRVAKELAESRPRANPWIPLDLAVPFVTSGIFEILSWWMRQDDNYPIEHVIEMFDALVVEVTAKPRKIQNLTPA